MYKSYKENYKIVFNIAALDGRGLYTITDNTGNVEPVYIIDLEKGVVLGSNEEKEQFLLAILYGADSATQQKFKKDNDINLYSDGIYDIISTGTYTEKLGVYYQEEIDGATLTPEADKTLKRVITYTDKD